MRKRILKGTVVAIAASAGLGIACGDDDSTVVTRGADAGDSGVTPVTPATDSGAASPDVTTEAAVPSAPRISPRATTRIANAIDPYGLVFASDGFLYASGATRDGADRKLAVWRFKDGVLDTTFGTGGVVTTDIPGDEASFDIVEISPGSFVVHAVAGGAVYLVKLTKDAGGAFSLGAPVFVKFGFDAGEAWPAGTPTPPAAPPAYTSWGIGVDRSNAALPKIVVFAAGAPAKAAAAASQRTDNDRWITRVHADTLAFDATFNGGAPYTTDADQKSLPDNARRGRVLADGTILSAGYTNFGTGLGNHVVLIRLKPDGRVDTGFGFGTTAPGTPGQTKFNPFVGTSGFAEAYGVVQQSSGRLVTTGYGMTHFDVPSTNVDLVSFGVKADGLDATFGKLGAFAIQSEGDRSAGLGAAPFTDRGRDVAVLPGDRLVHVGVYDDYATVFVQDKDGKLDPGSGVGGIIEYAYPAGFFKVAVSPDGKTIAATAQSLNQTTDAGAPLGSVLATLKVDP
jgi:uncharacterized delta-60 repeat protein